MTAQTVVFWQVTGLVLTLATAVVLVSFLIWCFVGLVLWFTRRDLDDSVQAETDPEWFEHSDPLGAAPATGSRAAPRGGPSSR